MNSSSSNNQSSLDIKYKHIVCDTNGEQADKIIEWKINLKITITFLFLIKEIKQIRNQCFKNQSMEMAIMNGFLNWDVYSLAEISVPCCCTTLALINLLRIFPDGDLGITSTKITFLIFLYGATLHQKKKKSLIWFSELHISDSNVLWIIF